MGLSVSKLRESRDIHLTPTPVPSTLDLPSSPSPLSSLVPWFSLSSESVADAFHALPPSLHPVPPTRSRPRTDTRTSSTLVHNSYRRATPFLTTLAHLEPTRDPRIA